MCGIVGLFLKNPALEPQLGALLSPMLASMSDRGPDSAGFAIYGGGGSGTVKLTIRAASAGALRAACGALERAIAAPLAITIRDTHAVVETASDRAADVRDWLDTQTTGIDIVSAGHRMEIYKEVGLPARVAQRFGLAGMAGTHAIGHTRMATESAVTTDGAHPFSTGGDQCLVHNGSLSNHNGMRRTLQHEGLRFATQNDTEVAAGYLTWRMREGRSLRQALESSLADLDGFFTFVVGTETGFAVVRDPIACKPAVMAETDDYVAFGSEYRALVGLPGIGDARVFEPEPATVYAWEPLMPTVDLKETPLRTLNQALHRLPRDTNETHWLVTNPDGRHAIAAGLDAPVSVDIDGNVGYYCAGMNKQATIVIKGHAGVGVAENMMSGLVHVRGDASQAAGATAHGGLLVIDGNAGARCGISMKGVDIVVKGSIGHMSAFMAQAGTLIVLGDAGEALGDSLYEAKLFVRGSVKSLGADCVEKQMTDRHRALLRVKLAAAGLDGAVDLGAFRRYGSARTLYHFHVDNAGAY